MWWMMAAALAAGGEGDVDQGWYLWHTGQDDAAFAVADALSLGDARGDALPFAIGMAVHRQQGPSVEAELRDRWSEQPSDLERRVALAWAITLRHKEQGGWCNEVITLLKPALVGETRFRAAQVDRERELRCEGSTEHAEAELRRIAKAGEGGAAEAVIGTLRAGYFKEGFPDQLEAVWTEQPHLLRYGGLAFSDDGSGPSKPGVRRVTGKALDEAMASSDPSIVHAAMLGLRGAGKDKPAEEARARLVTLDAAADTAMERSISDIADPPAIQALDACARDAVSLQDGLECMTAVDPGDSGSVAAVRHNGMRVLREQLGEADPAYASAKAAHQADPESRYYARLFADRARARGEDLEMAVAAAETVLRDRMPKTASEVPQALRPRRAKAVEDLAWVELAAGKGEAAAEHLALALELEDTPVRRHGFGQALAAAGRPDDAGLVLTYAVTQPLDDTAVMGKSRLLLSELLKDWHPGGLKGALEEVSRPLGAKSSHPLVGEPLPAGIVPERPEEEEEPPTATVVALWAPWVEASVSALERLDGISDRYAQRGVMTYAMDVGIAPAVLPEGNGLLTLRGSASVLRALRLVALPSVVVVDADGTVQDVLVGYDAGGLKLEEALDAFLPPEARSE